MTMWRTEFAKAAVWHCFAGEPKDLRPMREYIAWWGAVENNGRAGESDATPWLKNGCVRLKDIIDEANISTREHRNNLMWQNRLNQTRGMMKEQLQCVEKIMGGLGSEVMTQPRFYESMAKEIKAKLLKMGIELQSVYVAHDEKEGFFVSVKKAQCFGNLQCQTVLLPVINNVLGRHMLVVRDKCQIDKAENCHHYLSRGAGVWFSKGSCRSRKGWQYGNRRQLLRR